MIAVAGMRYRSAAEAVRAATAAYNAGAITYAQMDDRIRWARRRELLRDRGIG